MDERMERMKRKHEANAQKSAQPALVSMIIIMALSLSKWATELFSARDAQFHSLHNLHEYAACDGAMAQRVLEWRRLKWAARNNECNTSLLGDDDIENQTNVVGSFHFIYFH